MSTTIDLGYATVSVEVYGDHVEVGVMEGDSQYAEAMLDESQARRLAAALLEPWEYCRPEDDYHSTPHKRCVLR